jgi:hypothetical protein
MLVETPAMRISFDARSIGTDVRSMRLIGMADTMPCTVIVTREEVAKLFKLLCNYRTIRFVLGCVFGRTKNR